MSPQEESYLIKVNRNVKFSPWLTAALTIVGTMVSTSFVLGVKVSQWEAKVNTVAAEGRDTRSKLSEVNTQVMTNTAELKSLKDWRAEFSKK